jgi:hypothetical protein
MKRVPADEFARHAAEYLEGTETVSVEKNGEVIGRYVPVPNGRAANRTTSNGQSLSHPHEDFDWSTVRPESRATLERLQRVLQEVYAETGMTEDELADYFDMTKPFPYDRDPES